MQTYAIPLALVVSAFSPLPALAPSEVHNMNSLINQYRITQNILASAAMTSGQIAIRVYNDSSDNAIPENNLAALTCIAALKLPALSLRAVTEEDMSALAEASDVIALCGLNGFFSSTVTGGGNDYNLLAMPVIMLNNILTAHIFNAVNQALKNHCPGKEHEATRRLVRTITTAIANLALPALMCLASSSKLLPYDDDTPLDLAYGIFYLNTLPCIIAEIIGYLVAQELTDNPAPTMVAS